MCIAVRCGAGATKNIHQNETQQNQRRRWTVDHGQGTGALDRAVLAVYSDASGFKGPLSSTALN